MPCTYLRAVEGVEAAAVAGHYESLLGTPMADGPDPYKSDVREFTRWLRENAAGVAA